MINSEDKLDDIKDDQIEKNLENMDYPANEDIYNQEERLEDIDPQDISGERIVFAVSFFRASIKKTFALLLGKIIVVFTKSAE